MKKILASITLLGSLVSSYAIEVSDIQTRAGLAIQSVSSYDKGYALILNGAVPMPELYDNFSVEGEFGYSMIDPNIDYSFGETSLSILSLSGFGVYTHNINSNIALRARAGLSFQSITAESKVDTTFFGGGTTSSSDTEFELVFGVGGSYKIDGDKTLLIDYTRMNSNFSHLSAMVEFKL
jgi:hypothetical protein